MKNFLFCVILITCSSKTYAYQESPLPDFGSGYLTFYFENDLFAGSDRDYTNGGRISWISGDRKLGEIGSIQRGLRPFTGDEDSILASQWITGFEDPSKVVYNYGFSLTQLMYTPQDALSITQPENQRRYAGWTAIGFSLHTKDENVLNSLECLVGVTGESSYAQETQNFIHDIRDIQKFQGWENQIPTEVTVDLSLIQKRRFEITNHDRIFGIDGIGEWGGRLGTFRTGAHVGGVIRMGLHLPSNFSDTRLSETSYTHEYFSYAHGIESSWSLYTFLGTRLSLVGYDATLDGPLFHDFKTGNTREPFVYEVYGGLGFRYKAVEFTYAQTWRSKEYKEQIADGQDFGTFAISTKF
jgi:lipid A 3-O-deacylase